MQDEPHPFCVMWLLFHTWSVWAKEPGLAAFKEIWIAADGVWTVRFCWWQASLWNWISCRKWFGHMWEEVISLMSSNFLIVSLLYLCHPSPLLTAIKYFQIDPTTPVSFCPLGLKRPWQSMMRCPCILGQFVFLSRSHLWLWHQTMLYCCQ